MWEKYEQLKSNLSDLKSIVVAFSGGVDSSLVLKAAREALGEEVLAVTVYSQMHTEEELKESQDLAKELGISLVVLETDLLQMEQIINNPPDRCYHCKLVIFNLLRNLAEENGVHTIVEGSNVDDLQDYRPGRKALGELSVRSPLLEVGLGKKEIRLLAKELGLPNWNKPSLACLASRFPYNNLITKEKLRQVADGERFLRFLGLTQMRVRHHGGIVRIEVLPEEMLSCLEKREEIREFFTKLGFSYVTLDLQGYRIGSMNEEVL